MLTSQSFQQRKTKDFWESQAKPHHFLQCRDLSVHNSLRIITFHCNTIEGYIEPSTQCGNISQTAITMSSHYDNYTTYSENSNDYPALS